jgi:hypothetical protein
MGRDMISLVFARRVIAIAGSSHASSDAMWEGKCVLRCRRRLIEGKDVCMHRRGRGGKLDTGSEHQRPKGHIYPSPTPPTISAQIRLISSPPTPPIRLQHAAE